MVIDVAMIHRGFCDRLKYFAYCATVAELRGLKKIFLKDRLIDECPYTFIEMLQSQRLELEAWYEAVDDDGERLPRVCCIPSLLNAYRYKPDDLKVSTFRFYRVWKAQFEALVPVPDTLSRLDALGVDRDFLGLHIRRTDKIKAQASYSHDLDASEVDAMEDRTMAVVRRRATSRNVFLAADNLASRDYWVERLQHEGYKVSYNPMEFDSGKLRNTSGEDFLADLFGLARCGQVIATVRSGVPLVAAMLQGRSKISFVKKRSLKQSLIYGFGRLTKRL